jgi:hypothetical protein
MNEARPVLYIPLNVFPEAVLQVTVPSAIWSPFPALLLVVHPLSVDPLSQRMPKPAAFWLAAHRSSVQLLPAKIPPVFALATQLVAAE